MAERRDYVAMDWVLGEIAVTIKQACQALEAYVAEPEDSTRLRFCLSYTHQIQGTLRMLEFHGAALFAREMELLAQALVDKTLPDATEGIEALIAGLLQLTPYLDRARAARRDLPAVLLPMVNELRAVRGDSLLSASVLFSPCLSAAKPSLQRQPELSNTDFSQLIKNLRQMFQVAFVGIIRNRQLGQNLDYLAKVCQRLYKLSHGKAREPLWKVTMAVIEGLMQRSIEPNIAVKSLLKEIDSELKSLLQRGAPYLDQAPSEELMKNLLYYVARADGGSPLVEAVQKDYQLKEALAESEVEDAAGVDVDAMNSVVEALVAEVNRVKELLDLYARGSGDGQSTLEHCLPILKQVGDTLAVLGLSEPLAQVRCQAETLELVIGRPDGAGATALLDVAANIIEIEQALLHSASQLLDSAEPQSPPHVEEARGTVALEARNVLDQVKESIIEFVATQWDHSKLESVCPLLAATRGSLYMVGFIDAARILYACERYVDEMLVQQRCVPEWQLLDALADALSSVDYFLERYVEDRSGLHASILKMAVTEVESLGFALEAFDAQRQSFRADDAGAAADPVPDDGGSGQVSDPKSDMEQDVSAPSVPSMTLHANAELADVDVPADLSALAQRGEAAVAPLSVPLEPIVEELMDPDIAEIFIEEAAEVLDTITTELSKWHADTGDSEALSELRRAWHTLKGSGRMVGACVVGELAWSIENMLNRMIEGMISVDADHVLLVERVAALVPDLVARFEQEKPVNKGYVDQVIATVQQMTESAADRSALSMAIAPDWIDPERASAQIPLSCAGDPVSHPGITASAIAQTEPAESVVGSLEEEDEIWPIFRAEAEVHLGTLRDFVARASSSETSLPVSDALQRALHTLKGSANMVGQRMLADLVTPLEKLIKSLQVGSLPVEPTVLAVLSEAAEWLQQRLAAPAVDGDDESVGSDQVQLLEKIHPLLKIHGAMPGEPAAGTGALLEEVGQFMLDAADHLQVLAQALGRVDSTGAEGMPGEWVEAPLTEVVVQHCAPIARTAQFLGLNPIAELALACAGVAERTVPSALNAEAVERLSQASGQMEDMLDCLAADQALNRADPVLLEALAALPGAQTGITEGAQDTPPTVAEVAPEAPADQLVDADYSEHESDLEHSLDDDEVDEEILAIFVEEARELLENLDDSIHRWQREREERCHLDALQRQLHTLKGSARLAGLTRLGDLSHDFETFLSDAERDEVAVDAAFFARVQRYQDRVIARVERVISRAADTLVDGDAQPREADFEALAQTRVDAAEEPLIDIDIASAPASAAPDEAISAARQDQQAIKVSAQLIEDLVNLAGETSINRGRVDEQINEVIYSLTEMDATIDRMQEQLRRLDRETEAQLMFRQEQVESLGLEEFDPLEMDRYSVLQQLSRSLMESSYDVLEVKRGIFNKARDIETLLGQQSRINTDLQEGLMRSRMVPFSRLVPRLRRMVRQVSREVDKDVQLVVHNADGEMDRGILERMVPPFEHMLRNAVDHGIEARQERQSSAKADVASIAISFEREAGDIVITLSDDGRGVNLEAVKAKAIERGMATEDARLSDHDILAFILQPGFSTAQAVTQISGRGVGMDVVASEIKQLGGTVRIESTLGQGTSFIIRLPFTVSVNRALMVRICGESYALPLNTIEGIVRVSPFELESYYQPDAPLFEYAGQFYRLCYMGAMIGGRHFPDLHGETAPLPVILVRSGNHSVAIQVDNLLGSREIVVKTLGPQFSAVQGLSGATVLGDGGVVVILDLHAMIRSDLAHTRIYEEIAPQGQIETVRENRNRLVMVVDDSVTVRKVTSRFLERNGMDVLLAKDGIDAMRLLQDHTPDVMLLDIEMPRMDGFEVASRVKHSSRHEHLPIIMITSRTGQKHRERAESIGVDRYLGKPYQEMELLRNIDELTGMVLQSLS